MKKLQTNQSGFTIIEVLIVLAVAGLIMLIVFLAVPALQRNSRNTQRRNDVAGLLGAVNEWVASNQGKIPTTGAEITDASNGAKLGFYTAPTSATNGSTTSVAAVNAADGIRYVYGAVCDTGGATKPASNKAFAIQFALESSGSSVTSQCQDS